MNAARFPVVLTKAELRDILRRARQAEVEEARALLRVRLAAFKAEKTGQATA